MTSFGQYLGAALALSALALTLRQEHPALGTAFSVLAGIALLLMLGERLREAVETLTDIAAFARMTDEQTALILKMLGISLAAEFAAQACRDAGEEGIAMRVELGGKVLLLLLAAPLFKDMARLIWEMTS